MVMRDGFKRLTTHKVALKEFLDKIEPHRIAVNLPLGQADGSITAKKVLAPRPSPHYRRAAMDGFAVSASQTFGASDNSPIRLEIEGEVDSFSAGYASPIHTGGPVPKGADAVVKFEDTQKGDGNLDVFSPVAPGENVSPIGEDVEEGDVILERGHKITPSHLGLLQALGLQEVSVVEAPTVAIIPTGEELLQPGKVPGSGETIQSNGIMLEKYVEKWGGIPTVKSVLSDDPEKIGKALQWACGFDAVLFTGGSSVGRRDRIVEVLRKQGKILVHGVAIQPGKPVALGVVRETPVIALPGYPVATLVDAYFFARPLIRHLLGRVDDEIRGKVLLGRKIASSLGKMSVVRVRVDNGQAFPIRVSGSGVLSSVTKSDGFVLVPEDSEGIPRGKEVEFYTWR